MTRIHSFSDKLKQAFSFFLWELKSCVGTLVIYGILTGVFMVIAFTLIVATALMTDAGSDSIGYGFSTLFTDIMSYSISVDSALEAALVDFQTVSALIVSLMTVIFTVIYTIRVFAHLHSKRQTDLYGSMPVSRITLYFAKAGSAFVMSVVPALIFLLAAGAVSFVMGAPVIPQIYSTCLDLTIGTLSCVAMYGLISVCCGTTLNSVIIFISVCIAYPVAAMLVRSAAGSFFTGLYTGGFSNSFVMNLLNPISAYFGGNVIYWLIFTVICAAGAAWLIKNRRAERAQSSFAYYLPCHIIKALVCFDIGMFLGAVFGALNVLGNGFAGFAFGFIIASCTAFFVMHLIFYRGFTGLLKSSVILGALMVVTIGGMLLLSSDAFGYVSRVPDSDSVSSAGVFISENSCAENKYDYIKMSEEIADDYTDSDTIEKVAAFHSSIIDTVTEKSNSGMACMLMHMLTDMAPYDSDGYTAITYTLSDGSKICRYYDDYTLSILSTMYMYGGDSETVPTYEMLSDEMKGMREYQLKYGAITNVDPSKQLSDITAYGSDSECALCDTNEIALIIFKAYAEDFKNDTSSSETALYAISHEYSSYYVDYDYYDESTSSSYYIYHDCADAVCVITVSYDEYDDDGNYLTSASVDYVVPKSYTNTIKALQTAGMLDKDLKVIDSYDDESYTEWYAEGYGSSDSDI